MKKTTQAIKFYTLEDTFKKSARTKAFKDAYNEEIVRLRLAASIKQYRTKKHMTQAAVAKKAAMPQSVIARIEGGKHSMSLGTLNRIAQVLGREIQLV